MATKTSRRTLLKQLSAASCGAALASGALRAGLLQAIEPIQRNGRSKFKFSLAAYSYRDLLASKPPKATLEDFITDCAQMGLEGTELTSYYFPENVTPEFLSNTRGQAFRLGLDVSGTAVGNDLCHPAGPERDKQIAHVKHWVDNAALLGAPVIRIFSGSPHGTTPEEAHRLAVEGIEECCHYAGQRSVYLALENHGGLTEKADNMLQIVKDVKSPWFGVNLDSGNFHSDDIYGDLAKIAPYAVNVQIKVVVSGPDRKKQPSDYAKLAEILSSVGYRGYIVLEFEEPEEPRAACPRYMAEIRKAFQARG
jgi:sugar phosphate isomerase/epimerase